jgi:hypothetical protein
VGIWSIACVDDVREMLTAIYAGLHRDFTTEAVEFDRTVRNPSRVWRLYGAVNRKGDPSSDRPHRRAQVAIPARWDAVSPRMVEALAEHYARRPVAPVEYRRLPLPIVGRGDFSALDVVGWFDGHGAYGRPLGNGKHSVLCPWSDEHSTRQAATDSSSVVWETAGTNWPTFHCSHAHCEGRGIRDVIARWSDADRFCARAWARSR